MDEELTPNQDRLLNIAGWSKGIAWIVLVMYLLYAVVQTVALWGNRGNWAHITGGAAASPVTLLAANPFETIQLLVIPLASALKGVVYYLVLRGVSLGLKMIVETDFNFRQRKPDRGEL